MKTAVARVLLILTVAICAAGVTSGARIYSGEDNTESSVKLDGAVSGQPTHRLELSGVWKFQVDLKNLGQQKGWQSASFDASKWRDLTVPGSWEEQGVNQIDYQWTQDDLSRPYSGYAWYRRSVTIPADWKGKAVYLNLGRIDDNDWVYVNGVLIGQTSNQAAPADTLYRSYKVPASVLRLGQPNVIVVRVLDIRGEGGIVEGPVSITSWKAESVESGTTGRQGSERVEVGSSIVVAKNETVSDTVAVMGSVTVHGHVTGDAVAVMGNVTVMPGGRIDGDAVAVGGKVVKQGDGHIGGDTQSVGFPWISGYSRFLGSGWEGLAAFGLLMSLVKGLLFIILAVLVVAMFPARTSMVAEAVLERPGPSILYGLVGAVLILPIALLLLVSCVGIPLIAVEVLLALVAWVFARIAVGLAVGRKVGDAANRPISSGIAAAALGILILTLVDLVPFAGSLAVFVLTLIGFGAVILTGFGAHEDWWSARRARASAQVSPPNLQPPAR